MSLEENIPRSTVPRGTISAVSVKYLFVGMLGVGESLSDNGTVL